MSLDVGFYYSANAAGRLVGTLLSGVLYLWGGLDAALWGSAAFVAMQHPYLKLHPRYRTLIALEGASFASGSGARIMLLSDHQADEYRRAWNTEPERLVVLPPTVSAARRRPAGPVRSKIAANDDVPSIGGLIYALEQKPSTKVFRIAAIASAGSASNSTAPRRLSRNSSAWSAMRTNTACLNTAGEP